MTFTIIFSDQEMPSTITKSIFLAGPSPRDLNTTDWRHEALTYFETSNFDGTIFIPIPKNVFYGHTESPEWTYDNQIAWEILARQVSDVILFWIPRKIDINNKNLGMPAFTTNVEFGEDLHSGKIVYGRPDNTEKCRYLDKRILEIQEPIFNDLHKLILHSILKLGNGSLRVNGEIYIPLFIWNSNQFQFWYTQLKKNGNKLITAKLLHHFNFLNKDLFSFILHVNIWIEKEQRLKKNEFIFSRTNTSSILPFFTENHQIFILLVKEFRSNVNNNSGYIYELPGGSSNNNSISDIENAQHELFEETGINIIDINRFKFITHKQLNSTISTHHNYLYKIELNQEEIQFIKNSIQNKQTFGVINDSEIITLELVSINDIHKYNIDFSTLGMIFSAIF